MRDSDGGIILLHMLAACTASPVSINLQVFFIDLDVYVSLNIRPEFDLRKRCMTAVGRVERTQAHEAMYASLTLEIAIGIIASNAIGSTLDARFFAFHPLDKLDLIAIIFRPAQVHPLKHLRPILRVCAAR